MSKITVKTNAEFMALFYELRKNGNDFKSTITKDEAKAIFKKNTPNMEIFEAATVAANGGYRCSNGEIVYASRMFTNEKFR